MGEVHHVVSFEDVKKYYNNTLVVNIQDMSFMYGDRILISGRNGSGKSSILRLLAGVSRPESGSIWKDDITVGGRVGFLVQNGGLNLDLTVQRNLEARVLLCDIDTSEIFNIVKWLRLECFLNRRVLELSGAQQRMVALAATLVIQPDWLLLDEPFATLDDDNANLVMEYLAYIVDRLGLLVIASPQMRNLGIVNRRFNLEDGVLCEIS